MEPASPPSTVLIVDDDKGLARLIEKAVRREGVSTAIALSGEEALTWLKSHHADLMLLDLKLPDFHGKDMIDRLETISCTVPFIIITGQGDERVAVDMMKRGALDYLLKDVEFLEFVPVVVRRALSQLNREKRLKAVEDAFLKEQIFGNAVLLASGAMMIVLDREGSIVKSNLACERVTGYSHEYLEGKPFFELFFSLSQSDWKSAQTNVIGMLSDAHPRVQENFMLTKNGERRLISWSITTLFDSQSKTEFIIASGMDITESRRLEQEILEISDREQRRIGQDLHDGLGQEITAIALLNCLLQNSLKAKALPEAASAERLAELINHAGGEIRRISHGLQPVSPDFESLTASIRRLVADVNLVNGAKCVFRCDENVVVHNHESANHLYRIAQEAMQNALRHGKPGKVIARLTRSDERVILEVQDDGYGIARKPVKSHGIGLRTMKYRTEAMNGYLDLIKPPEGGTLVRCSIPDPQYTPQNEKAAQN